MPYLEAVFVVNGHKVLSKWKQSVDLSFVTQVDTPLLTSLEGLDDILVGCIHPPPIHCQALEGVRLHLTCDWMGSLIHQLPLTISPSSLD